MKVYKTKDRIRIEIKTEAEIQQLQLEQLEEVLKQPDPTDLNKEAAAARRQVIGGRMEEIHKRLVELADVPAPAKRVVFVLAPLTRLQKGEVLSCVNVKAGQIIEDSMAMSGKAIRFALKGVEGLLNADGTEYKLALDAGGVVTDEALDDLLNLDEASQVLITASLQLAGTGISDKLKTRIGGSLEHVVVVKDPKG